MPFIKKGIVIPLGAAADSDDAGASTGSIIFFQNKFFHYYAAGDGAGTRVGLAISKDGTHFTKKGIVLPIGAGPESAEQIPGQALVVNNKVWLYSYGQGGSWYSFLSISKDGIHFTKKGVVLVPGAGGEFDDIQSRISSAVYVNNKIYAYYTTYDGSLPQRCGLAISKDGTHFIKKGVVKIAGAAGESDDNTSGSHCVIYYNNKFYMFYSANDGTSVRCNLAISKDGTHFTKKGVVIPIGGAGESDVTHVNNPSAIVHNNKFYIYYEAYNVSARGIALAISKTAC